MKLDKDYIRECVPMLTDAQRKTFRLMYGRLNGKRSVEEALALPMNTIINEIPASAVEHCISQIEKSLESK